MTGEPRGVSRVVAGFSSFDDKIILPALATHNKVVPGLSQFLQSDWFPRTRKKSLKQLRASLELSASFPPYSTCQNNHPYSSV